MLILMDSASTNTPKKFSWGSAHTRLREYFDTLYYNKYGGPIFGDFNIANQVDNNKQLLFYIDNEANTYNIQAIHQNNSIKPISLNPQGGGVRFRDETKLSHIESGAYLSTLISKYSAIFYAVNPNGNIDYYFKANNLDNLIIDSYGNGIFRGNVTAYSDERLKDNIVTIPNALEKVLALRGVEFDKDGTHNIGVIAQEVREIIPEVVLEGTDEMKTLSVAYGNLVGLLIEAIKEQQIQIDELKAKVH